MLIMVTVANAFIFKWRSRAYSRNQPGLKRGYDKLFLVLLVVFNIPWVIIGIGNAASLSNNMFEYFNPSALHPVVLVFHTAVIGMLLLTVYWIYFRGGAAFLSRHPGLLRTHGWGGKTSMTATEVKIFMGIALLGCIAAMVSLWIVHMAIPPLK